MNKKYPKKKIALVTGALGGIGYATTNKFLNCGYTVIGTDIKNLQNTENHNGKYYYKMDVTDRKSIDDVVNIIEKDIGEIDVLISLAGIFETIPIDQLSIAAWDKIFSVNTTGVFNVTQIVANRMKKNRSGNIIVVSSNAGKCPRKYMSAYAASKAATSMYTKCLGLELAEYGIRCNIVSPGSTDTKMQRKLWNGEDEVPKLILEGDLKNYRLGIPLKKIATPCDIAETIYFLASDDSGHITLEDITIDGGATMGV